MEFSQQQKRWLGYTIVSLLIGGGISVGLYELVISELNWSAVGEIGATIGAGLGTFLILMLIGWGINKYVGGNSDIVSAEENEKDQGKGTEKSIKLQDNKTSDAGKKPTLLDKEQNKNNDNIKLEQPKKQKANTNPKINKSQKSHDKTKKKKHSKSSKSKKVKKKEERGKVLSIQTASDYNSSGDLDPNKTNQVKSIKKPVTINNQPIDINKNNLNQLKQYFDSKSKEQYEKAYKDINKDEHIIPKVSSDLMISSERIVPNHTIMTEFHFLELKVDKNTFRIDSMNIGLYIIPSKNSAILRCSDRVYNNCHLDKENKDYQGITGKLIKGIKDKLSEEYTFYCVRNKKFDDSMKSICKSVSDGEKDKDTEILSAKH